MSDWVCYLITSLNSNDTYIGSSNNQPKRLEKHNAGKGAKNTRGQTWVPILVISGFHHKNACLSFEAGWKKLCRRRNNQRLETINKIAGTDYWYTDDTKWNRILDLLYFVHHFTLLGTHFKLNYQFKYPTNPPGTLLVTIFMEDCIKDFPWPYFIKTESV